MLKFDERNDEKIHHCSMFKFIFDDIQKDIQSAPGMS